jgi:hypothetical protein
MTEVRPGAIVSRAFEVYRDEAVTVLGAALIIFAIQFLLVLLLPNLLVIPSLVAFVLSVFYGGMVVNLVRDVQDGRRDYSMGELFGSVTPVLLPLLGLAIVAGIGIAIGFVLIIIPGLILLTIWAVASPVMVVEHPGVFAALGRSRDLVRGYGWPVFLTILLAALIELAVSIVASIVASGLSTAGTAVVNWIATTLTAPIFALTTAVLYFALVAVKEPAGQTDWVPPSPFGDEPRRSF